MAIFMFNNIYNLIYLLGLQTLRLLKKFGKRLKEVLLRPLKAITTLLFTAIIVIDKFTLNTFHEVSADAKSLFTNTKRVVSSAKNDGNGTKKDRLKKLPDYFSQMWRLYKHVFAYAGNIILPIVSFIIMLNVIFAWSGKTFALELNYNGKVIGYVKSEAVYKQAKKQATERLQISTAERAEDEEDTQELIGNAEYSLKTVKLSKISDADAICESLIENSNCEITNACGVYIDDNFLCAVKNETDALAIFDNILSVYEDGDENSAVSFVENINYVQGLYPDNDNTVWDAERLSDKLNTKKSEARYYTVEAGDSVSKIADKCSVSLAKIFALNPELKENIRVGQKILIEGEVNFVQVQITKTETHTEVIKHSTVKVNTDSLYIGDSKTVVKGVDGEQLVTELVTYIDGVKVSSKEVSRVTTKEPVEEKIQVGTKKNTFSGYGNYNYSYSGAKFCWPGVGATIISSRYGKRALNGWHNGIDLCRPGGSKGAPVVAAESGKVIYAGYEGMGGNTIRIDHGNGLVTMYCHLKTGSISVKPGQYVTRGQQIAQIGDTGFVTGAHLHFEVRVNGNRVNPAPYLGIS